MRTPNEDLGNYFNFKVRPIIDYILTVNMFGLFGSNRNSVKKRIHKCHGDCTRCDFSVCISRRPHCMFIESIIIGHSYLYSKELFDSIKPLEQLLSGQQ